MPPGKAPVDKVGGTKDRGQWPEAVEEIAVDDRLQRPVEFADGTRGEVEVTVTTVDPILRDGEETGGYVTAYQFDDPTLGGGV